MGWFSTTPADAQAAKQTDDGSYTAPDRTARALCWEARDAFFRCLDEHDIIDSVKQDGAARKSCGKSLAVFERDCVDSWVTYFKKRRVMEFQREATLKRLESEGAKTVTTVDEKNTAK